MVRLQISMVPELNLTGILPEIVPGFQPTNMMLVLYES
jgi:hypothetical protein